MLRSYMMKNEDFAEGSTSTSSTTTIIGLNGNKTEISESKSQTTNQDNKPEKEVEEFKVEEYKPNEVEQVYESPIKDIQDSKGFTNVLKKEQSLLNIAENAAEKAREMSEFDKLLNDFSSLDELDPNQDSIFDESGCTENDGDDDIGVFITHI